MKHFIKIWALGTLMVIGFIAVILLTLLPVCLMAEGHHFMGSLTGILVLGLLIGFLFDESRRTQELIKSLELSQSHRPILFTPKLKKSKRS